MATKGNKTTKPLSAESKALLASLRAADEKGQSAVGPTYRAMDNASKKAFVQSRAR